MRKRKHKGNFKRQQHKTNQKKFKNMHTYVLYLCVCEIERERERDLKFGSKAKLLDDSCIL